MTAADLSEEAPPSDLAPIIQTLTAGLVDMSPQVRQAAVYVLDNPGEVAVTSMRGIAESAGVKPNTLVRMARAVGFDGYENFRRPFQQQAVDGSPSFPDRARFLQSINQSGRHGALLAEMAAASLGNVEALFADIDPDEIRTAADRIVEARRTNVLGVGIARPLAENFAYVASMAIDSVAAIPTIGLAIDDVGRMGQGDVLLAMTFSPYRSEIVDAVALAARRNIAIIAVTDSWAAPIVAPSVHAFVVPNDSPLPFSSTVAAVALLESLLAFVVAEAATDVVSAIDTFHQTRRDAGIYTD